jgi:hypothetical protein
VSGSELYGAAAAQKALQANMSPRYMRLDNLERYVIGTQYEGRAHFWDDEKPLYERAPSIVHPIAASAINSVVDMCLGEGRWPAIHAQVAEDTAEDDESDEEQPETNAKGEAVPTFPKPKPKKVAAPFDDRFALTEEDSETLDALAEAVVKQAKLRTVCESLLKQALSARTSVAVCCIRDGRLAVDTTLAKRCRPKFSKQRPQELESLEIRYPYLDEYFHPVERKWAVRVLLYRRVIDAKADTTFHPIEAPSDGVEPKDWRADPDNTIEHGFGFCPARWYAHRKECSTVAEIDGHAIHERLLDEIDAHNYALSQRNVAAMVAASPPTVEIGVNDDDNPAPMGRTPKLIIQNVDADGNVAPGGWSDGRPSVPARKRGPGVIWRYPSPESKVEMLTMGGDSLKPIDDDARDLRAKIAESMGVVFVDPNDASFSAELSGKAIARLYDRQIRLCDKEREDFGDNCLLPLVDMLLRIALHSERTKAGALYLPGLKEALPILERFEQPVEGSDLSWFPIPFDLAWGPYFAPDAAEEKATVETVTAAHSGGYITQYSAVEKLRDIFGIKSVAEYMQDLEKENQAKEAKAAAALETTLELTAAHEDPHQPGTPGNAKGAPGKPAAAAALGGKPKGKLRSGRPGGGKPARGF